MLRTVAAITILFAGCSTRDAANGLATAQRAGTTQRNELAVTPNGASDADAAENPQRSRGGAMRPGAFSWPCWLGPDKNGISHEADWSATWPESGPEIAWRGAVGTGFSAVSVADGRLYTMGYREGQDVVYCLNAATGENLWEFSYPCELVNDLHEGGPAATPTIDGDRVLTLSREGHLHCLDAQSGELRWQHAFKTELGAVQPQWGFTSSPLVAGELVVVDVGYIVAVDRRSGEIVWKSANHRAGYGTAMEFDHQGRRLLAVFNNDGLFVLAADDGRQIAVHPLESQFATTSTTPIIAGDRIFVSVGYGGGCALLRLAGSELDVIYESREMSNHFNNCVLYEGHLYGFDGNSHVSSQVRLVCMDFATGEVKWHQRGYGCGSLMVADGKLILLSDEGTLAVAPATPEGLQEESRAKVLDGRCWTMPVLVDGRIYCRNAAGDLVCVLVR